MKRTGVFLLASAGVIGLAGALLLLVFPGRPGLVAIGVSAAIALCVQVVAFSILRSFRDQSVFVGWGIGSVLRLGVLVAYALIAVRSGALPAVPALLSLATFLFATMFLEPLFLERR